ncbi:uncharacterized protein LOC109822861 [Asparagus officinalis]|nr:uncharacterized protein LOC109822861 [Asparagus officinalis]
MKGKIIKKRLIKVEICASKKEKINKLASSAHIFHKLQDSKHKVLPRKNSKNLVDSKKNSVYMKNLPKSRKLKLLRSSKQTSKEKIEPGKALRVHHILNNPTRRSTKKAGAKTNTGGKSVDSCCGSEDLVDLSGKSNMHAHAKTCSSIENTCKGDSLPAADDVAQAENSSDISAFRDIINRADETSAEKEQLLESHSNIMPSIYTNPRSTSCSDPKRDLFSIPEDHCQSVQGYNEGCHFITGNKTLLASDPHDDPRNLEPIHSAGLSSHSDIQSNEISPKTLDSPSLASRFDPTGSLSFIRNLSPPNTTSCSITRKEETKMQIQPPIDPLTTSYWQILPPKDFRSSAGCKLVPKPVPISKDKCNVDGFVGLPLNSQGEFIHSQSAASFDFGEISKKKNAIQGSIRGYPFPHNAESWTSLDHVSRMKGKFPNAALSQKVQPSWYQRQYNLADVRNFDNFGVQSNNEAVTDRYPSFLNDHNIMEVSCQGCRDDIRTRNYIDRVNFQAERTMEHVSQPNIQQTMRLMGTNVTVTGNNKCQSYGDGRIWIDKEVVSDQFGRVSHQPMQQQWVTHSSSMKPKNNLVRPLDTSSNFYSMPAIAPRLGVMHFNYRPQWVSRNDTSSVMGNTLFSHPLNSQSLMNDSSKSLLTTIPGITSVKMGHQIPVLASNHPNSYQHMLLSSTHCKHTQGITYSTTSTFRPPISYHETFSPVQPSPAQSSMNLPRWLLNAKQQRKSQRPPCSCFPDPLASHHRSSMSRADIFPLPSPHHTSAINFPICTGTTSIAGGLSTPFVQSSLVPPSMTSRSKPAIDNSCGKNMIRGGTNFNFTYLKSLDAAGKTRKRAAAKDDRFMKPAKKPFFRMQDQMAASANPRQEEQMHANTVNAEAVTDSNNSGAVTQNEGSRTLSLCGSLKVDGGLKSGPVKLTAGAKHVLKPSQDLDQDISRSIHSTIPFSTGDNSGKVIDPQMTATEIYRF